MKTRGLWIVGAAMIVALAGSLAVPRVLHWWAAPPAGYCPICRRHEHAESLVKFEAAGERPAEACCLSCALTYGRQTGKAIRILSVADHERGTPLDPDSASFVVGSDVSPCTQMMVHLGPEKEAYPVQWDRCLPSILAFPSVESAERFRAQHGGRLRTLPELLRNAGTAADTEN